MLPLRTKINLGLGKTTNHYMSSAWSSIWNYKCPRCRQGDLYKAPLDMSDPLAMHERCSFCQQSFEPEPHFYQGAMFIGYGISIWYYILPGLFFVFYLKWSLTVAMTICIIQFVLSLMLIIRLSRSIWIHIAVKYNPKLVEKLTSKVKDR